MTPLVSCLMVTKSGREPLARRAIENFHAQAYSNKELVIVADTPEVFTSGPNVIVVRALRGSGIGRLRALSVAAAKGDLVAVWDDDDEHHPLRLLKQIGALLATPDASASVLEQVTLVCSCGYEQPSAKHWWEPTLVAYRAPLPAYRDIPKGEDTALLEDIGGKNLIAVVDAAELYRYHYHGANNCTIEHWQNIFESAGRHHDVWKCASDRGLLVPEADDYDALLGRIKNASSPSALARVTVAIERFRAKHTSMGPGADQRAELAVHLAAAFGKEGEYGLAEVWALRALQSGPRTDAFCILGQAAELRGYAAIASRWYETACGTTVYGKQLGITQDRHERLTELREHVRPHRIVRRGVPTGDHVLAVMTCAGREKALAQTMKALNWAGIERWRGPKLLVCDGALNLAVSSDWIVVNRRERPAGQAKTFLDVLQAAAGFKYLSALTLFEDDVALADNALDYIAEVEIDPDLALISWFTIDNFAAPFTPFLYVTPAVTYRPSNQGITFPAATVREVVEAGVLENWSEPHGADAVFLKMTKPCAVHFPNLVQHTHGNESLTGNVGARLSTTFPGESFDALKLWR